MESARWFFRLPFFACQTFLTVLALAAIGCFPDPPAEARYSSTHNYGQVSAGTEHSCGLKTDGGVACWGKDEEGRTSPPMSDFR